MIRDITIGQYFPGQSAIHRMDPRTKIILSILYIVMLFVADNMWGLLLGVLFGFAAYLISRIPVSMIWKSMKPVVPIVIFTAVLNLFLSTGDPLWQWKFLKITKEGIETAVFMSVRILCLIAGTSLLTYTTSPIALTDGIERLLSPLKKIKLPVHELAMMMTIALRFIPTLIEETDKIMSAQKARGADLESGGVMQRAKALLPILIPLFVSAFRRADELALAMECRCYHGGEGRTKLSELHYQTRDWVAYLTGAALLAVMLLGEFIGFADALEIRAGIVFPDGVLQFLKLFVNRHCESPRLTSAPPRRRRRQGEA